MTKERKEALELARKVGVFRDRGSFYYSVSEAGLERLVMLSKQQGAEEQKLKTDAGLHEVKKELTELRRKLKSVRLGNETFP